MKPGRFRHFVAIDWSGAAGERHRGIAVALCSTGDAPPELVRPGHRWSRPEALDWLLTELPDHAIVGFDMGISLAHADAGAFFPGWAESPGSARELWALIDRICTDDPHLSATSLVDHPEAARIFGDMAGARGIYSGVDAAASA